MADKWNHYLVTEDRDRLKVESSDIVSIVNKRKKSERYRFSLSQWRILQHPFPFPVILFTVPCFKVSRFHTSILSFIDKRQDDDETSK